MNNTLCFVGGKKIHYGFQKLFYIHFKLIADKIIQLVVYYNMIFSLHHF